MEHLRNRPIRQKITIAMMMVASAVLLPAFAALFGFQLYTIKQHSLHELAVMGEMTAHNCAAAVMFKDKDASAQILGGLRAMPQIVSGQLELVDRQRLASFGTYQDDAEIKRAGLTSGFLVNGDRMLLAQPVIVSGKREGTLYLLADLHTTTSELFRLYSFIFALVLAISLFVSFLLSRRFLGFLTGPILRLASVAQTIAERKDYSVRASKACGDEVGFLTDAFNQMLDQIQSQDGALRGSEEKLAQAQRLAHLGHWERDLDTDRIRWSEETYRIFGIPPDQSIVAMDQVVSLIHPEDQETVKQAVAKAVNGGPRYDIEYRVIRPNGDVRFVHSQGDILKDETGQARRMFGTVQDITERKHVEEARWQAEEKYRVIFENAIEGIFQTTPEGKYLSANPALARMYGYDSADDLIRSVNDIGQMIYVDPQRRNEFRCLIEAHGFVELFEYEVYRKDHSKIWLCENARAVRDATGTILYYEGTAEDITHRKRVEEVERANQAKSEFLSRVSHELRTPLNAILGFGQLLERQNPTETQRTRIRYIVDAGKHLLKLINEVLDISRIESGRIQFSLEPVSVATALTEALELMRPLAAARNIRLPNAASFDRSVFVLADNQRFKQVLLNLLTNAVNYNLSSGSVTVSYKADGKEKVRIFISDTGIGIPEEKINRLFMPFERLGAEHSNVDGTGLGLALSQRLMQAMGGLIGVESEVGKGSTFWMELPETRPPVQERSLPITLSDESRRCSAEAHRKVLYIEDNLSNLALVEQLLEERPGIELLPAKRGEVGLALAQEHLPDLILLDVHLPDCDGGSVLSRLKASEATCDIPVIILSADATNRQIDRLMTAGASTYLTKPIDVADFFRVLDKTADTSGKRSTAVRSSGSGTEIP